MPAPRLRRLIPEPTATTTVAEAYTVERRRHDRRPWVGVCMIASLDGTITIDGDATGLGNPNDLDVLLTLRRLADMIIAGASTAVGDGYGPPSKPGQRIGVVTNRAAFDMDTDLFRSGAGFLIAPHTARVPDHVEVLRAGIDTVDLSDAFTRLHEIDPTVGFVQVEGGAVLNAGVVDADLVDELDLTVSPLVVGGDGPRMVNGASERARRFDLAHLLADDDGYLFTRWTRRVGAD